MICPTGKYQFKTNVDAVAFNKNNWKRKGEYFNVYCCQWCGDWHLSSRIKKVKRFKLI